MAQQTLRKTGLSRSSPSLVTAAAFNLRDFSTSRSKVKLEPPPPDPLHKAKSLEKIDLIGGNGRFRQRQAEEEFERRRIEEEERLLCEKQAEAQRQRKQAARLEQRRRVQEDEDRRRRMEEARKLEEQLHKKRLREKEQERERLRKAHEASERERRAPKTCQTCSGSGVCQLCNGAGIQFALHLVSHVTSASLKDFGKTQQGCTDCGGCRQGIRGELKKGSGKCNQCMGYGKITPTIIDDEPTSPKMGRTRSVWLDRSESFGGMRLG